jgi:hypothetical protein
MSAEHSLSTCENEEFIDENASTTRIATLAIVIYASHSANAVVGKQF